MTLTFDWFLPTSGDGRAIYGRGHGRPLSPVHTAERAPGGGDRFGEGVLPELRRRGQWAAPWADPAAGPGERVREFEGAGHGGR